MRRFELAERCVKSGPKGRSCRTAGNSRPYATPALVARSQGTFLAMVTQGNPPLLVTWLTPATGISASPLMRALMPPVIC